jgi:hypothetical protein
MEVSVGVQSIRTVKNPHKLPPLLASSTTSSKLEVLFLDLPSLLSASSHPSVVLFSSFGFLLLLPLRCLLFGFTKQMPTGAGLDKSSKEPLLMNDSAASCCCLSGYCRNFERTKSSTVVYYEEPLLMNDSAASCCCLCLSNSFPSQLSKDYVLVSFCSSESHGNEGNE